MSHFDCPGLPDLSLQGYDASEFRGLGVEVYKLEDVDALVEKLIERITELTGAVDKERVLREQLGDALRASHGSPASGRAEHE